MLALSNIAQESNENWVLQHTNTCVQHTLRFLACNLSGALPLQTTKPGDGETAIYKAAGEAGSDLYSTVIMQLYPLHVGITNLFCCCEFSVGGALGEKC
jgi:hypothetical protein